MRWPPEPHVGHGGGDAGGPEEVDLHGLGERRVEGDGGGGVDDDVRRGQGGPPFVVEAQAVAADVTGHGT